MKLSAGQSQAMVNQTQHREAYKRLYGHRLFFARIVWIAIVVLAYALVIANIPAYFASLHLLHVPKTETFSIQLHKEGAEEIPVPLEKAKGVEEIRERIDTLM